MAGRICVDAAMAAHTVLGAALAVFPLQLVLDRTKQTTVYVCEDGNQQEMEVEGRGGETSVECVSDNGEVRGRAREVKTLKVICFCTSEDLTQKVGRQH